MLTSSSSVEAMTRLGRAMSDPTRARILLTLIDEPSYPAVLADELDLTRTNVSNHLTCLRGCGLVVAEQEGRQTRYSLADPEFGRAVRALVHLAVDRHALWRDTECVLGCCQPVDSPPVVGAMTAGSAK